MSNIRLRRAGLIGFTAQLLSAFTGLLFVIIVSRRLTPEAYGAWQLVISTAMVFLFPSPIITYWIIRFFARKIDVARTGLTLTLLLFIIIMPIYLIASFFISIKANVNFSYFVFGILLLLSYYIRDILNSLINAVNPEKGSISFLISEISKVIIAVLIVFFIGLSIFNALFIVLATLIIQNLGLYSYTRKYIINSSFNKSIAKDIIKNFWIPLYNSMSGLLGTLDGIIIATTTGLTELIAYYKNAAVVATLIAYSSPIAGVLYPKILGSSHETHEIHIKNTLDLLFMILIPSSIGVFILARPILYILRPDYTKVTEIAQLLIISQIIQLLGFVAQSSLLGMETADINNNHSFHELKKSLLIRVPTINIISNAFYIIGVTIASLAFSLINSLIIYIIILSLIYIISQTFNTYILWHMLSKKVKIKLNHQPIIKYLIASIIMGIVLFYAKKIIKFTSVYETAPEVLITIGIGAITYIIILYVISKEFRSLTKVTINEIRQSLHK
jgi:O-antigen/teichoic acid export membrane protein